MLYDREVGSLFLVKYSGNSLKMRLAPESRTFGDVQRMAAEYFGIPQHIVFLSDKEDRGVIYMHEQIVQDELFPLMSAKPAGHAPVLYLILQRKMTQTNFLDGGVDIKDEVKAVEG